MYSFFMYDDFLCVFFLILKTFSKNPEDKKRTVLRKDGSRRICECRIGRRKNAKSGKTTKFETIASNEEVNNCVNDKIIEITWIYAMMMVMKLICVRLQNKN